MYRLLAIAGENRERRRQRTHPARKKPELIATAPNQVWSWDIERREALFNRAGVRDHRRRAIAVLEAGGSLIRETPVRVGSSPDNAGTAWYCQTGRVRLARREGVREEPAAERFSREKTPAPTWRMWAGQRRAPAAMAGNSRAG